MDDKMTDSQERHLDDLKDDFIELVDYKYRMGAKEHQTDLKRDTGGLQLLDFMMEEVIDLYVYLRTLQQKIEEGDTAIED